MILTEHNLEHGEVLSSQEELVKDYPCTGKFLEFFKGRYIVTKNEKNIYRIYLYTNAYEYVIVIFEKYCGGFTTVRKRGIKESWDRGNDMLDGVPSEELFNELALDMLKNELIYLGKIEYKTIDEAYGCLVEEDDVTDKTE
jgi:hypothetical protein